MGSRQLKTANSSCMTGLVNQCNSHSKRLTLSIPQWRLRLMQRSLKRWRGHSKKNLDLKANSRARITARMEARCRVPEFKPSSADLEILRRPTRQTNLWNSNNWNLQPECIATSWRIGAGKNE